MTAGSSDYENWVPRGGGGGLSGVHSDENA